MAELRILVALVLSFVCVKCAVISGKDFFCRDPDTGKLHAVNTTWASSSFCGNFTCALRKRNETLATKIPTRQFTGNIFKNKSETVMTEITIHPDNHVMATKLEPGIIVQTAANKIEPSSSNATQKPQIKYLKTSTIQSININDSQKAVIKHNSLNELNYAANQVENVNNNPKPELVIDKNKKIDKLTPAKHYDLEKSPASKNLQKIYDSDKNRYLTDEEINNITDILRTVKRSDLDAIIEVYSLAQEIYEEMDKTTDKELVDETVNILEESKHHLNPHQSQSYWYDHMTNKGKMADRFNMDRQDTKIHTTVSKPTSSNVNRNRYTVATNYIGTVSANYPLSEFQRKASYMHPVYQPSVETAAEYRQKKKICDLQQPANRKSQKLIQTSRLLPFPYTNVNRFNTSNHYRTKYYYNNNPWALDYLNRYYYKPYFNIPYTAPLGFPKAVVLNPNLSNFYSTEQVIDKSSDATNNALRKTDTLDWKTDSLSIDVLKDIRANIDTSRLIKAFPWRKRMTLEKVGSVNRMDDLEKKSKRSTRSAVNDNTAAETLADEYEPFLVRVMCKTQTEPGYFSIGNMSEPYPNCCPQLLNKSR